MPTDPGEGLAFSAFFLIGLIGVFALMLLLAWLEAPAQQRQQARQPLKNKFAAGQSAAVTGRDCGTAQPVTPRRIATASTAHPPNHQASRIR